MQRTQETSEFCPSILFHNGLYFIAWTGTDKRLNLLTREITNSQTVDKFTFPEKSKSSPCLAANQDRLYLAWTGEDDHLNVAQVSGKNLIEHVKLTETSELGPSITFLNGKIFVSWKGSNGRIEVGHFNGSSSLKDKFISVLDTTVATPTIAGHDGLLYVAWNDTKHAINLGVIQDKIMVKKSILEETTFEMPLIVSENNQLKLAWVGTDIQHHLNLACFGTGDVGRIQHKQFVKAPYTEDVTLHVVHKGSPTLHFHRFHAQNVRINRHRNIGVGYANGYFAMSVCYDFPPLPREAAEDVKHKYEEYQQNNHMIYLYPI
jgi:hypothetical protein